MARRSGTADIGRMIDGMTFTSSDAGPGRERRLERRADPLSSLTRWLDSARKTGELEALAVADETGVLVAGAGLWQTCELLAGMAAVSGELTADAELRSLTVHGVRVLICGQSRRPGRSQALDRAAQGCVRILEAPVY